MFFLFCSLALFIIAYGVSVYCGSSNVQRYMNLNASADWKYIWGFSREPFLILITRQINTANAQVMSFVSICRALYANNILLCGRPHTHSSYLCESTIIWLTYESYGRDGVHALSLNRRIFLFIHVIRDFYGFFLHRRKWNAHILFAVSRPRLWIYKYSSNAIASN